jgi:hypothetical protein
LIFVQYPGSVYCDFVKLQNAKEAGVDVRRLVPVIEGLKLGGSALHPRIIAKSDPLVAPGPRGEVVGEGGQDKLEPVGWDESLCVQRVLRPDGPLLVPALWNLDFFFTFPVPTFEKLWFRFRFQLLKSYGSGSGSYF